MNEYLEVLKELRELMNKNKRKRALVFSIQRNWETIEEALEAMGGKK